MKLNLNKICSAVALCFGLGGYAFAADHAEAPAVRADPSADINDVYTFMNPQDSNEIIFILTVFPNADSNSRFSDAVSYDILLEDDGQNKSSVSCTFDNLIIQTVTCTGPNDITVSGLVDNVSQGGQEGMRVFFGLRDDPFFFDFQAFLQVIGASDGPGFVASGGTNDFAPNARFPVSGNTLAISIGLNRDLLPGFVSGNDVLRVYAATTRLDAQVQ